MLNAVVSVNLDRRGDIRCPSEVTEIDLGDISNGYIATNALADVIKLFLYVTDTHQGCMLRVDVSTWPLLQRRSAFRIVTKVLEEATRMLSDSNSLLYPFSIVGDVPVHEIISHGVAELRIQPSPVVKH